MRTKRVSPPSTLRIKRTGCGPRTLSRLLAKRAISKAKMPISHFKRPIIRSICPVCMYARHAYGVSSAISRTKWIAIWTMRPVKPGSRTMVMRASTCHSSYVLTARYLRKTSRNVCGTNIKVRRLTSLKVRPPVRGTANCVTAHSSSKWTVPPIGISVQRLRNKRAGVL